MFRNRLFSILKAAYRLHKRTVVARLRLYSPVTVGLVGAYCEEKRVEIDVNSLEHEFLIRQATTVNVNAATQLLTVTMVAIQDTNERLQDSLSKEICLVQQALEWGDEATPPQHWDELVAVRGTLSDLNHNLGILLGYMEYAQKLATTAAEISYLSGNMAASDAICERIDQAHRTCNTQKQLTHDLQQESLELQKRAILTSPQLEEQLKNEKDAKSINTPKTDFVVDFVTDVK